MTDEFKHHTPASNELQELKYEVAILRDTVKEQQLQIEFLLDCNRTKPKLVFQEQFPDTIIKMTVQLFHNEPRQGVSERVLKCYVWDDRHANLDRYPDGYFIPFIFPLHPPAKHRITGNMAPIEQWAEQLRHKDDYWIGCLTHKGSKKTAGTSQLIDHAAYLDPHHNLHFNISGQEYDMGYGAELDQENEKAAHHIWFFSLDISH